MRFTLPVKARSRALLFGLTLAAASAVPACAQGPGGGMHGGMPMPGGRGLGMPGPGSGPGGMSRGGPTASNTGTGSGGGMRGGTRLGPPGRWWDDRKTAKSLGLNGEQQKRMDSVFSQNRDALQSRFDNWQKAQAQLEKVKHSDHPSDAELDTEIDHVAQAHADLEKAYTHMQLQIRDEMTPDQINRLDDIR